MKKLKAMINNTDKAGVNDFAEKIIDGLKKGLRKMAETAAANDESLIIGNLDGTAKSIPAKELLKKLPK